MKIPVWCWWIIWVVVLLIVLAVCKVNIHLGSEGFGITQGLVR
jgi:hypothetical protein